MNIFEKEAKDMSNDEIITTLKDNFVPPSSIFWDRMHKLIDELRSRIIG